MSVALYVTTLAVAILLQAFFVSADVALSACNRSRLRLRAEGGSTPAAIAEHMIGAPSTTTATVLIGGTGATLAAVLATGTFLADRGWSPLWTLPILMPRLTSPMSGCNRSCGLRSPLRYRAAAPNLWLPVC